MPLEIKELVIKVNVNEGSGGGAPKAGKGSPPADKKAIIAECLEQVMDVLQKKKER